jgi:spermidine dehydrogenase
MSNDTASDQLGMTAPITRRDFVNGTLVGTGAALLAGCGSASKAAAAPFAPSGSPWTGYGGVGDYAWANGNTEAVIEAAHGIRDRTYPETSARPIDEQADLVVVGGGFSGVTTAYEFLKHAPPGRTCLLLENHPMLGGEARQNEIEVDGRRLTGPQGSNGGLVMKPSYVKGSYDGDVYDVYTDIYRELGLPTELELEPLAGGAERFEIPNYHFAPMAPASERSFETGYHFKGHGWVTNPSRNGFIETPWTPAVQKELDDFVNNRRDVLSGKPDAEAWLDTITYYDLLDKLGYGEQVRRFVDPYLAVANFGVSGGGISAYAVHRLMLPGTKVPNSANSNRFKGAADIGVISFPGGNAAILRMMLARMIPGAIAGDGSVAATASSPVDFKQLDRPGARLRIRLDATAIDVRHEGDPAEARHVVVTYARDGKIRRVRARAVVMASGGWVNRNVIGDLSDRHRTAYADFCYGPVLTANIAVRNWRFLERLGFINTRWFDGLGWHMTLRRNVSFGSARPLTPGDPIMLTLYIAVLRPELPAAAQGQAARADLLAMSYIDIERRLRTQMTEMFGSAGFDARRDIAGIVINRWGHAFIAPQPGFFRGKDGVPPPPDVIRQPHGRIGFAHSELNGLMSMAHAMREARRAAAQALAMF